MDDMLVSVNTGFKYGGHAKKNTRMYEFVQFFDDCVVHFWCKFDAFLMHF